MIRKLVIATVAASLTATPVLAKQVSVQRDSAPVAAKNELGGSSLLMLIGIAVVAAGILLLSEDNDPVSA